MTGNMLFEILDPFLMWKQIYLSLRETISGSGSADVSRLTLPPLYAESEADTKHPQSLSNSPVSSSALFDCTMKKFRNYMHPSSHSPSSISSR